MSVASSESCEAPDLPRDEGHSPVSGEMARVEQLLCEQFDSKQEIIRHVSEHLNRGGKRIRPLMCLLTARMLNPSDNERCVVLATAIELIHTATLLHDDVVDHSKLRRGRPVANLVWSDEACILIGDYLYSRAFQLIASLENHAVARNMSRATNIIAFGEVEQYINQSKPTLDEATYITIIREKTAVLFEASCYNSALLCAASEKTAEAVGAFGRFTGIAFQIMDDVLDYGVDRSKKMAGDDLVDGKLTLPVIHALAHATASDAEFIRAALSKPSRDSLPEVVAILNKTGSLDYARSRARAFVKTAQTSLETLPASPFRAALAALADRMPSRESASE